MHSDEPRHRGPLARLADLLARTADGSRPTSIELAELVWLARQMDGTEPTPPDVPDDAPPTPSTPPPPTRPAPSNPAWSTPDPPRDDRVPLRLPAPTGGSAPTPPPGPGSAPEMSDHTPLRVPVPPMVTHPLALQRALRPLKRRVPSPVGQVIDEEATAHRIARLGGHPRGWLPVLRPADERWLRLCLVYDAGPTMPIWRPLVHELHTALAQSGIFRTVELHRATPDGKLPPQAAHGPATGRTVVLLISDCMGPQWREGPAGTLWYRTLHRWASQLPLALIQPLPERLWRTTALPTTPGTLSAPHPASPSASLTFTPYAADPAPSPSDATPIPVLEPSPTWLSHWASLVADAGGSQLPGSVAWLMRTPPAPEPEAEAVSDLTPEDLVLRFRSTASPEAFRLAGHLAVGEPQLPVMRLVQAAVEERPRPQHLAEVILSGMLSSGVGAGAYEFRDGVRELLLRTLPRTARGRTRDLLARVGGLIDERAGVAPGELRAVAPSAGGGAEGRAPAGEPFATVTPESVRQLGGGARGGLFAGRYRLVEQLGQNGGTWRAEDVHRPGTAVVVKQYPQGSPYSREWGDRLVEFRHENVARVIDHGVDDASGRRVAYLVTEFVDGGSLQSLLTRYRYSLRTSQLHVVVPPLADAVNALHYRRLPLQSLRPSHIIVTPRGPVLTADFALSEYSFRKLRSNLSGLASLVSQLSPNPSSMPHLSRPEAAELQTGTTKERIAAAVQELYSSNPDVQGRGAERLINLSEPSAHTRSYSVLGPLRVTQHGRLLAVDVPEEQALLCMLLLQRGRTVSYAELAEGIRGPSAPVDREDDLHAAARRLDEALGPGTLIADDDGYSLPLPSGPDSVDLFHCQRLASDAQDAYFAGDFTRSRQLVRSALELWRGTPLLDVPGPAALATRVTIAELRQSLLRTWGDLEGRDGDASAEDAAELADLLQEFPHTEDEVLAPHEELPSAQLDDLGVSRELPDDQPTPPGTTLTFEYLTRPTGTQSETLHRLGREISHLFIQGGIGPDRFEMRARQHGWDVTVAPEVHVLHVLTTTVTGLRAALAPFPVLGLVVTLTHDPDPTVSAPTFPTGLRRSLFSGTGAQAVVVVSNDLHDRIEEFGRLRDVRFEAVPQSDDWYCRIAAVAPPDASPSNTSPSAGELLASADAVVIGFDGLLTRLHPGKAGRDAARRLAAVIAEQRSPEAALKGDPLLDAGVAPPASGSDEIHPLDVLRAFARNRSLAPALHHELAGIETAAVHAHRPTASEGTLLNALAGQPRPYAVVADTGPDALSTYMAVRHAAPDGGIHGRTADLTRLMPDPDCLRRAVEQLGRPAARCVMIGSSPREATAAKELGMPFIGYAPGRRARERLADAGVGTTVGDLTELISVLRGT
ncbi:SAV_2336 N-terminal domain-related protein [Streptomyces sp. NPDC086554]|uniref:SAV_2336 N-terminal domain-related protein n=1 Tax=Streptomyces sp. NPDC086554 TaxID=3154864 RepID=UPI003424EC14